MLSSEESDSCDEDDQSRSKSWRILKILLPHISLSILIVAYLLAGAAIFQRLERDHDFGLLRAKSVRIAHSYRAVYQRLSEICRPSPALEQMVYNQLNRLSQQHQVDTGFQLEPDGPMDSGFGPRWDYMESVLYALSILTTTGYTRVTPGTNQGQILTIVYGLIGIPIMVITAVDIGRFLSDCLLYMWSKVKLYLSLFYKRCCICPNSPFGRVKTRLIKPTSREPDMGEVVGKLNSQVELEDSEETLSESENIPLVVNASVLLLFCMIGAACYQLLIGKQKKTEMPTFIDSFFVTFNLVANLTMAEIPVVEDLFVILFVTFFVTFGLAVLSMCGELAANELKWIFMKIHFFGRKMAEKRKSRALSQLDVEVKELLKIIDEIRLKYPEKEHITPADILAYMHEMGQMGSSRRRRDTVAFIPDHMDAFRFADDNEEASGFHQHHQQQPIHSISVPSSDSESESESAAADESHRMINRPDAQQHQKGVVLITNSSSSSSTPT